MSLRSLLLIVLVSVGCSLGARGWAMPVTLDDDNSDSAGTVAVADGTLTIGHPEVTESKRLWEQPEYQITLHNKATGKIEITSITVRFLQSSLRDALGLEADEMQVKLGTSQYSIGPTTDLDQPTKIRLPKPQIGWAWLAFTPNHYDLKIIVKYSSVSDRDQREYKSEATFKIPLAPDFLAIVIGAVAGCLVLVITLRVIGTYKFVARLNATQVGSASSTPIPMKQLLGLMPPRLLESVLLFFAGSVAACVALAIAGVTNDARIIMSLQIHDAMGGFTLGFLSLPLIDVVLRFAQGQLDKTASSTPVDPPPTPP